MEGDDYKPDFEHSYFSIATISDSAPKGLKDLPTLDGIAGVASQLKIWDCPKLSSLLEGFHFLSL